MLGAGPHVAVMLHNCRTGSPDDGDVLAAPGGAVPTCRPRPLSLHFSFRAVDSYTPGKVTAWTTGTRHEVLQVPGT